MQPSLSEGPAGSGGAAPRETGWVRVLRMMGASFLLLGGGGTEGKGGPHSEPCGAE